MPTSNTEGGWSCSLAEYIRHNDMPIHEAADKALKAFQEEFMPVETFSEFLDAAGQCQGFSSFTDLSGAGHCFHLHAQEKNRREPACGPPPRGLGEMCTYQVPGNKMRP